MDIKNKVNNLDTISKMEIRSNDINLYNNIMNYELDILTKKWGVLLYHYVNDIPNVPRCYCGELVKFKSPRQGYREFCSKRCMYDSNEVKNRRKETSLSKYGVENPSQSPIIREKIEQTNLELFGERYPLMNKEIHKEMTDNLWSIYGVENVSQLPDVRERRKNTMVEKYGVETYSKHKDFIEKAEATKLERYNNKNYNNREKYRETIQKKYGVDSPMKLDEIKNKSKETNLERYGQQYYTRTDSYLKMMRRKTLQSNIDYFRTYNIELVEYISNDSVILKCDNCNQNYQTTKQLFRKRITRSEDTCVSCNPVFKQSSTGESELYGYISEIIPDTIVSNSRDILFPQELDIYIPSKNIAIEFNGLYWHSELHRDKDYHLNKTNKCLEKGINLFHIWEDDWLYKQDIVKSMVLNKLGQTPNKIYGRKTKVKEITEPKIISNFLNENHLQGAVGSSIKLGLYYNNELVSVMSFGKLRKNLGQTNKEGHYEMLRFCNKKNTTVVGGASKLFKYFVNKYTPNTVISYASRDHSDGNLYKQLGFELDSITRPGYHYIVGKVRKSRFNFRKDKLIRSGHSPDLTEREIMFNMDYYRIYNTGNYKFVYNRYL